nr:PREDICTED: uncharacterized protein LOC105679927 [Linepithema humile]
MPLQYSCVAVSRHIEKCVFGKSEIAFLGYKITSEGTLPLPDRVVAIREYKKLENVQEMKRFLGLINAYDRELAAIYNSLRYFRYMVEGRELKIRTDHKPLVFAFKQKPEKALPHQLRQLDFISQFTTNIKHIVEAENVAADALFRIETIAMPVIVDDVQIAWEQKDDEELEHLLKSCNTLLRLQKVIINEALEAVYCDVSTGDIRPYIPKSLRRQIFDNVHRLSHSSGRSTAKVISKKFVWPSMNKQIMLWAKTWPEAIPLKDIEADTIANALYTHWIARFGAPRCITTDQGSQFEARLFNALKNMIGCKRVRTTAYHPQGNGMIERSHRTIKTALMCHEESNWIDALPVVLLGIQSAYKDDIKCTPAEIEEELDEDPEVFVERFREIMRKLRPTPTAHHIKDTSFVFKDLYTCTHVFLRDDTVKKPLKQPYFGPFKILERITDRVFKIRLNADKELVVNTERLKPAYQLQEDTNMTPETPEEPEVTPANSSNGNITAPTATLTTKQRSVAGKKVTVKVLQPTSPVIVQSQRVLKTYSGPKTKRLRFKL